jgi:Domain of unknown function (DUF1848)
MRGSPKIVLSASRRTDIPAFYMEWFMERMAGGLFEVRNPYNGKIRRVIATADTVHTIVFWSKNFGPFLEKGYGHLLRQMGIHLFFNFTVNTASDLLEPQVPPLSERLLQMEALARTFSPACINWRFDPVCRYRTADGRKEDNLKDFQYIAEKVARSGITRCVTSFMDLYPKVRKRAAKGPGVTFLPISLDGQRDIILDMKHRLTSLGMALFTCCEKELQRSLPPEAGIGAAACISNAFMMRLFGGRLSLGKDGGQRGSAGCGCQVSVDIGDYREQPCFHNCLYCYASPAMGRSYP